ncbi:hypothetical protein ACOME3_003997 [Neoechinorhynchus agilis]
MTRFEGSLEVELGSEFLRNEVKYPALHCNWIFYPAYNTIPDPQHHERLLRKVSMPADCRAGLRIENTLAMGVHQIQVNVDVEEILSDDLCTVQVILGSSNKALAVERPVLDLVESASSQLISIRIPKDLANDLNAVSNSRKQVTVVLVTGLLGVLAFVVVVYLSSNYWLTEEQHRRPVRKRIMNRIEMLMSKVSSRKEDSLAGTTIEDFYSHEIKND